MNIYARNLEIFVNLVKSRSFTKTAEQMFMTQPAVSTAIKNLENYYGATLLQRGSHRMDLTVAGKILYRHAQKILADITHLDLAMSECLGGKNKRVSVGVSNALSEFFMPVFLKQFYLKNQRINIDVIQMHCRQIVNCILEDTCDIGLFCKKPEDAVKNRLLYEVFLQEPLYIIAPKGHPLLKRKAPIEIRSLLDSKFIFREESSGCMKAFSDWLAYFGLSLPSFQDCSILSHIQSIKNMVLDAGFLSVLARSWVKEDLEAERFGILKVAGPPLTISYYIAYLERQRCSRAFNEFYNALIAYIQENAEEDLSTAGHENPQPFLTVFSQGSR